MTGATKALGRAGATKANKNKVVKRFHCSQGCGALVKDGRAAKIKKRKTQRGEDRGAAATSEFCVDGAGVRAICTLMRPFPPEARAAHSAAFPTYFSAAARAAPRR